MAAKTKAKAKTNSKKATDGTGSIVQLKATLLNIAAPVWRRLDVPDDYSLGLLHHVLQYAFGWDESHLHQFDVAGTQYGPGEIGDDDRDPPMKDEERISLRQVVRKAKKFLYEYDFGDGWEHAIVVEKTVDPVPNARYPRCTAGERACPPEDSGGPWGYADMLVVVGDPSHPEHGEMLEWLGADFDPEAFDRDAVNRRLSSLAAPAKKIQARRSR